MGSWRENPVYNSLVRFTMSSAGAIKRRRSIKTMMIIADSRLCSAKWSSVIRLRCNRTRSGPDQFYGSSEIFEVRSEHNLSLAVRRLEEELEATAISATTWIRFVPDVGKADGANIK